MNSQKMPLKNSLCLLLAATIWGIAFVAQSVGMEYVGPFTFNGVRSLIGAAVLVPLLFILNRSGNKSSAATDSAIPESSSTPSEKAVSPTPYNSRDLWLGGIACYHLLPRVLPGLGAALPTLALCLVLAWLTRPRGACSTRRSTH